MKKLIAAVALTLAVPVVAAKPLISIDGGLGYSMNTLADDSTLMDGTFDLAGSSSTSPYGLGMEASNGFYGWAKISLPVFPDVRVKYESMVLEGTNNLSVTETIFGETFTASGDVDSELDLSYLDLALTFGLPLPAVDVDFGLNLRSLIGGFKATQGNTVLIDEAFKADGNSLIIPMIYASVGGTLPVAGIKLSGELSTLPIEGLRMTDWNVKGTWYAPLPTNMLAKLGLEAGYRSFSLDIGGADFEEYATNVGVSGFFMGAALHF